MTTTSKTTLPTAGTKPLHITLWIAQVLLAAMFLMAGLMKATTPINELAIKINWADDMPEMMVRFIGISEFLIALGLLFPSLLKVAPRLTPIAASCLVTIMLFAIIFHITRSEFPAVGFNLVIGLVAFFVAWGRFKKVPIQAR